MSSVSTQICEAVVAELNNAASALSKPFTAQYIISPDKQAESPDGLQIYVFSLTETIDLEGNRGASFDTYQVRIAAWSKLSAENAIEETNELIDFMDEVKRLLKTNNRLTAFEDAALIKMDRLRYDPASFENYLFCSVITCDYMHEDLY